MSIRRDEAQLIITIDAKESLAFQKTLESASKGVKDLKNLSVESEAYNKTLTEQAKISKQLASSDYAKLSQKQLTDRRKQLIDLQRVIPGVTFAEQGFEKELRQVNVALAENARRVRGVSTEMQAQQTNISSFRKGLNAALGVFSVVGIIEGVKAIGRGLFNLGKDSITAFDGAAKAQAQLEAGLNSTGNAVGRTVEQLTQQASDLQKITLFSDDQTQEAQGILLTFTKVREEIFDRSIPAIQDYATRMKVDLSSAAVTVGKALNDPVKGMGALSRAGVQFTEDQKEAIKQMVATGDVVGAQTVILKELETQFQGSAKAAAEAGLGPLQVFQNRIDDIKEGIGLLITNGLGFLNPILEKVALFAEKVVDQLINGTKATGEMSTAVNGFVGVMRFLGGVLRNAWDLLTGIYNAIEFVINQATKIPLLSSALNVVIAPFKALYDVVVNTSAVMAGFKAAFRAAFDNAADYVNSAITSLKIFAKEAELAITFDDKKEAALQAQIKALEAQKTQYAKAGKTVGQAYSDAYNEVVSKEVKANSLVTKTNNRIVPSSGSVASGGGVSGGSSSSSKEDQFSKTLSIGPLLTQSAIRDAEIKKIQERELASFETFYLEGKISEEEYQIERNRINSAWLATRIDQLDTSGAKETTERRELYNELLKVDKEGADLLAQQYFKAAEDQLTAQEQGFVLQLANEQVRELSILQARVNTDKLLLQQLEDSGLQQTEIYRKVQEQLLADQVAFDNKRAENTKKTEDIKKVTLSEGFSYASDIFALGADLLAEDEKARRKNATAIKAFQIASVTTDGISEVAAIWRNANANAANGIIPGWALIQGGIQSALAVGRTTLAISKISKQKFSTGHLFRGRSHAQGGIDIRMPDGNIGEVEDGEPLLNKRSGAFFAPVIDAINTYNGWGKSLYGTGASFQKPRFESGTRFQAPNTTPSLPGVNLGSVQTSTFDPRMEQVLNGMVQWANSLQNTRIGAVVSLNDLESASATKSTIVNIASYR